MDRLILKLNQYSSQPNVESEVIFQDVSRESYLKTIAFFKDTKLPISQSYQIDNIKEYVRTTLEKGKTTAMRKELLWKETLNGMTFKASKEIKIKPNEEDKGKYERVKTRLSFIDSEIRIDTTEVITNGLTRTYEIEIEIIKHNPKTASRLKHAIGTIQKIIGNRTSQSFRGALPKTIDKKYLEIIRRDPSKWAVSRKLDGLRVLLQFENGKVTEIHRSGAIIEVGDITFKDSIVLDCEKMNNTEGTTYIIIDAIDYHGKPIKGNLQTRINLIISSCLLSLDEIKLELKSYYPITADRITTLNQFEDSDGLVFTRTDIDYPKSRTNDILKWKATGTIDFHIKKVPGGPTGFQKVELRVEGKKGLERFEPIPTAMIPFCSELEDLSIVEFDISCTNTGTFKATFRGIRLDKLKANYITTAMDVIHSTQQDITINELSQIHLPNLDFGPMRKFHNMIKNDIISVASEGRKGLDILELACGRGGDIFKWEKNAPNSSFHGVDISNELLNEAKLRSKELKNLKTRFTQGDLCKDNTGMDWSKEKYDIVSCQFALHYFFQSDESLANFCEVLRATSKEGTYFIATLFDGNLVSKSIGKNFDRGYGFEIIRDKSVGTDEKSKTGRAIKVKLSSDSESLILDTFETEYLVDASHLVDVMESCQFELVDTRLFVELDSDLAQGPGKSLSDLNRYWIFKKTAVIQIYGNSIVTLHDAIQIITGISFPEDTSHEDITRLTGINIITDEEEKNFKWGDEPAETEEKPQLKHNIYLDPQGHVKMTRDGLLSLIKKIEM